MFNYLFITGLTVAGPLLAQSGGSTQLPSVQQVSLSGRQSAQSGSVSAQQSANAGNGSSVNTSSTSLQVQGSYAGSVADPGGKVPATLTLETAIQMGLRFNLGTVSAGTSLRQGRAQRLSALSQLLPTLSASLSETGTKTDLQTIGLTSNGLGLKGVAFPTTVGPYHYYDARVSLNYNVLNFTAIHNLRQAKESELALELSDRDARELVVLAVGGSYLRVLADIALVESQEAQVKYAQSSYEQALAQNQAGTKSLVDTERSQVELQTEQQRLTSQKADLIKQIRSLARIIGMPFDAQPAFEERLPFTASAPEPIEQAINTAFAKRADLRSAQAQMRASQEASKAAHAQRLPSVSVTGYAGLEGINPNAGNGVFSGTASVSVPIFQGGRIRADEDQARAAIDQRRAEFEDQRRSVEQDVRNSYLDLQVATEQVKVAESNRHLALATLQRSQDRFVAGVANSVEVVQSQESLASANRDYISSLYSHNVAKINLARAMGEAENSMPTLLKGPVQ
jgi:outer membrane protein TolC